MVEPIVINFLECPGVLGVQEVVRQIKAVADPDPWSECPNPPVIIRGTEKALRLASLLRWEKIPGVDLVEVSEV